MHLLMLLYNYDVRRNALYLITIAIIAIDKHLSKLNRLYSSLM